MLPQAWLNWSTTLQKRLVNLQLGAERRSKSRAMDLENGGILGAEGLWLRSKSFVIGTPRTTESPGHPLEFSRPRPPFRNRAIFLPPGTNFAASPEISRHSPTIEALVCATVPQSISTDRVPKPQKILNKSRISSQNRRGFAVPCTLHGDGRVLRNVVSAASNKQLAEREGPWFPLANRELAAPNPLQIESRRGSIPGREPRAGAALVGRA